jgi:hypothetical protein
MNPASWDYRSPTTAVRIGHVSRIKPAELTERMLVAIRDLGSVALIVTDDGQIGAAIPNSRPAILAERRNHIFATYVHAGTQESHQELRTAIREDLEHIVNRRQS